MIFSKFELSFYLLWTLIHNCVLLKRLGTTEE